MQQQKNIFFFILLSILIFVGYQMLRVRLWPPPPRPEAPPSLPDDHLWWGGMPGQAQGLMEQMPVVPGAGSACLLASQVGISSWTTGSWKRPEMVSETPSPRIPLPDRKLWAALPGPVHGLAQQGADVPGIGGACRLASLLAIANWSAVKPIVHTASHKEIQLGDDANFYVKVTLTSKGAGVQSLVLNNFKQADKLGRPEAGNLPLQLIPPDSDNPSNVIYHYANVKINDRPDDPVPPVDTLGQLDWKVEPAKNGPDDKVHEVSFTADVPDQDMTITKTYTLAPGDYHLGLTIKLERRSTASGPTMFRYQMVGAHGLPVEGVWYTNTYRNALIGRADAKGNLVRDLQDAGKIGNAAGGAPVEKGERFIQYAGIATQYFASLIVLDDKDEAGNKLTFEDKAKVLAWVRPTLESLPKEPELQGKPFLDDITVRVISEPVELKPGVPVVHRYLLYNGPVKVRLLTQLGDKAVAAEQVNAYEKDLHLNTLTDYGRFFFWSDIIIFFTNLMHGFLWWLHRVIPNYGLCIILLTVMVRGMMFPLSRRQAISSARMQAKMQELAPEVKKLEEKHRNDPMGLQQAKNELYMKRGIHVGAMMGSCWIVFLQMPIFLGLYYSLQESIHFRLAPFLWMKNLAAPDMLFEWGDKIPYVSRWSDLHSSWIYLGPFFNLLPIIAVIFMIIQQKLLTPPATDEQQAMQQKMMKFMMIIFGFMFYKVAAGLCLYFIASSLWGLTERKVFLRNKTAATVGPGKLPAAASPRSKTRPAEGEGNGTMQKLRGWWGAILKEAEKKKRAERKKK